VIKYNKNLPEFPQSYWINSTDFQDLSPLTKDKKVDITIIGGGISGITTAYLLVNEGFKVAVIEADKILHGTTGHTTAKVTVQHGLIYDELIQNMGKETAELYYQSNNNGLNFIKNMVMSQNIDCDFSGQDAYIYTKSDQYVNKLSKEYNAYEKLGIRGSLLDTIPIEIPMKKAIVIKNQAQFHPLKYLYHLTRKVIDKGGLIYEHTVAVDIEEGDHPVVITKTGQKISSNYVIIASHFPFYAIRGLFFSRMYVKRSYVLGVKTKSEFPGGMYINAENPTRSLRLTEIDGENLVLISGESHKVGQGKSEILHYKALMEFGEETLGLNKIKYRWSTQDLITLDKVPYVGYLTSNHQNVFVATGYRKWGMTNSTAAALLLKDLILKKENPFQELYSPSRFYMDPSLKKFFSINMDVAKHLIKGKFEIIEKNPSDLEKDEGSVVTINGKRAGAYRDHQGDIHLVDTTCTHLGCELEWNDAERTWDCPCHGSRYSIHGEVIEGPTEKPLDKIKMN